MSSTLSNVSDRRGGKNPLNDGLASGVILEVRSQLQDENSDTGVSSLYVPIENHQWFVLRATYNRVEKEIETLRKNVAFVYLPKHYIIKQVNGKKKRVYDDVGIADPVHTEICRYGQGGYKECIGQERKEKTYPGERIEVFSFIYRYKRDKGKLCEEGENICHAFNAYVGCRCRDDACVSCHQPKHWLCENNHDARQSAVHGERNQQTGSYSIRKLHSIIFHLANEIE